METETENAAKIRKNRQMESGSAGRRAGRREERPAEAAARAGSGAEGRANGRAADDAGTRKSRPGKLDRHLPEGTPILTEGARILPEDPDRLLLGAEVTVLLLAHNQEDTIGEAIQSVLFQSTSFRTVLLVHDDASEDRTGEICESYQKRYPDRIVLIREKGNQYRTGTKITTGILLPLVRSPYIAFLEGDDRWQTRTKLEKQVRLLREHPACTLVCTGIQVQEAGSKDDGREDHRKKWEERLARSHPHTSAVYPLSLREIFEDGDLLNTQFSSFAARTDAIRRLPSSLRRYWFGDWVLATALSLEGTVLYWAERTTCYRLHSRESTADAHRDDRETLREKVQYLQALSEESAAAYQPFLRAEIRRLQAKERREDLLHALWQEEHRSGQGTRERSSKKAPVPLKEAQTAGPKDRRRTLHRLKRDILQAAREMTAVPVPGGKELCAEEVAACEQGAGTMIPGRPTEGTAKWHPGGAPIRIPIRIRLQRAMRDRLLTAKTRILLTCPAVLSRWERRHPERERRAWEERRETTVNGTGGREGTAGKKAGERRRERGAAGERREAAAAEKGKEKREGRVRGKKEKGEGRREKSQLQGEEDGTAAF